MDRTEELDRREVPLARLALTGGGPEGNERLTSAVSVILLVALAVIGVTLLRLRQLTWLHLFIGLMLLGPMVLKMASTGYRFVRYYTHDASYRLKGPPEPVLRVIAPAVVVSTVVVFASGVVLLFLGPAQRGPFLSVHKISFIVWLVFTALHVLGHLPALARWLRAADPRARGGVPTSPGARGTSPGARGTSPGARGTSPGARGRSIALVGTLAAGLVLAIALLPQFGAWTRYSALAHHHHRPAARLSGRTRWHATL